MRTIAALSLIVILTSAPVASASARQTSATSPVESLVPLPAAVRLVQSAEFDMDNQFVELMNAERAAAGLNTLVPYDDLIDDAAVHTTEMLASGDIYHSSDLKGFTTGWQTIGENVGYGPNVDKLHAAFMQSPTHRANIMGDYDRVGAASEVDSEGRIYVTVLFMKTLGGYVPPPQPDLLIGAAIAATLGVGLEP